MHLRSNTGLADFKHQAGHINSLRPRLQSAREFIYIEKKVGLNKLQGRYLQTSYAKTALQIGRSRVSLSMVLSEFFIDIIFLAELWPWNRLSL